MSLDDENPWQSPEVPLHDAKSPRVAGDRPDVYLWLLVYCGLMAMLYLCIMGMGLAGFAAVFLDEGMSEEDRITVPIGGAVLVAIGLALCTAFMLPFFVPRRPWVWIYDLVLICLGMTSVCTMPFCIPLLIFWLKPETKAYFGRA